VATVVNGAVLQRTVIAFAILFATLVSAHAASSFKKISDNRLLHVPSGVVYPSKVALFIRADKPHYYDSTGLDVSQRYVLDALVLADVYVYPSAVTGGDLKREVARQNSDIRRLNKNVRVVSESSTRITQAGRTLKGKRATYDLVRTHGLFASRETRCGSQLIVFQDGPWFIAYRFSYPGERSDIAAQHVNNFVSQWQWRER
jgi:hypothetical protein